MIQTGQSTMELLSDTNSDTGLLLMIICVYPRDAFIGRASLAELFKIKLE